MDKKKLVNAIKNVVSEVYQHQTPKDFKNFPVVVYYTLLKTPLVHADDSYFGSNTRIQIDLYDTKKNDVLYQKLENELKNLEMELIDSREMFEEGIYSYRLTYETIKL